MKEKAVRYSFHYLSKPISPVAARAIILDEIEREWITAFGPAVASEYENLSGYRQWKNRPTFRAEITQGHHTLGYNCTVVDDQAGKIFRWTDLGTGLEGPRKRRYKIIPKKFNPKYGPKRPPTARKGGPKKPKRTPSQGGVARSKIKKRKIFAQGPSLLQFKVPYQPMTMPMGGVRYDTGAAPRHLSMKEVNHPGTRPRHFSQRVILRLVRDFKGPNTFYQATMRGFNRGIAIARARGVIP